MGEGTKSFIYKDARGNITARTVTDISESEAYIQAFCTKADEHRTFRKDRIVEYVEEGAGVTERLKYLVANSPEVKPIKHHIKNSEELSEVCFTGFKAEDKKRLAKKTGSGLTY